MNAKLFSEAMSEVNDKYYEEAENYHCPKNRWIKFASLAACAAIVLAVSFATLWKQFPGQTMPQPDYNPPIIATVYKGNIIKNLIMDCQSYTKYRPNETTGGIFVSWRRKEELPTGA